MKRKKLFRIDNFSSFFFIIIKCLSNIPELKYYFYQKLFPYLKGNIKDSISEAFAELLRLLWQQDNLISTLISPHSLKVSIRKYLKLKNKFN